MSSTADSIQQRFLRFALAQGVLRFGTFTTKAGRASPYFFNAGLFHHGAALAALADFYAEAFLLAQAEGRLQADRLFGPAYKGITLASSMAMALAARGHDIGFAFNRKEAKDHGEGGLLVGADLRGHRVLIIDDVISAGTSVGESVRLLSEAGATPAGVLIALDRMERGGTADQPTDRSAVQEVAHQHGLPVVAIVNLSDLLALLTASDAPEFAAHRAAVEAYRARWGVA
ncbi:MAG: orotate phosphoribosyltransferase [Burkholderiaceae bacterium]